MVARNRKLAERLEKKLKEKVDQAALDPKNKGKA